MQSDAKSRGHLAEFHYGSADAPHTEAYLWPQIVTLCAELGVRRVIDIGCGNGALCRELASRGSWLHRSQKNLANDAYDRTETELQCGGLDD